MTVACPLRLEKIALVVPPAVVTAVDIVLIVVVILGLWFFIMSSEVISLCLASNYFLIYRVIFP